MKAPKSTPSNPGNIAQNPGQSDRLFYLPLELWQQMRLDVIHRAPEEACGLVAGDIRPDCYQARVVFPITNELHSPVRFRLAGLEHLEAFNQMDAQGQDLVGIYHSHPQGPDEPSPTDIAEAQYPESVYLIWSKTGGEWLCLGYRILDGQLHAVAIIVV